MASLGTKIMDAFRSSDSPETDHMPGSFPVDDMTQTQSATAAGQGSQQKGPQEPDNARNPEDSHLAPHVHRHTDSGVGLESGPVPDHNKAPNIGPLAYEREDKAPSINTHDVASTNNASTGASPYGAVDEYGEAEMARDTPTDDHTSSRADSKNHRYWGDIPRGVGVYNTVTGHGSSEDAPHKLDKTGGAEAERSIPQTTMAPVDDHPGADQQRAFPVDPTAREPSGPRESKLKEDFGVAAAVGAGAGLSREHHGENNQRDPMTESLQPRQISSEPKDKDSKVAALFHRDHKDDKGQNKLEKRQPRNEKSSKIAGFSHRDRKHDNDMGHEEAQPESEPKPKQSEIHHERDLGDAMAAAQAAYAAKVAADRGKETKSEDAEQPQVKKDRKLHGLFHRGNKDKPTMEEAHERGHETAKQAPPAIVPALSRETDRKAQDSTEATASGPEKDQEDLARTQGEHRSWEGPAAAAAAVAGAGAVASHHYHTTQRAQQNESVPPTPPPKDTSVAQPPAGPPAGIKHDVVPLAGGTAPKVDQPTSIAGLTASKDAPTTSRVSDDRTSAKSTGGGGDKYNVLPTGTLSGVKTGPSQG